MSITRTVNFAICSVEDCTIAFEAERDEDFFCPTCKMEMITSCPSCGTGFSEEDQVVCLHCEQDLKN